MNRAQLALAFGALAMATACQSTPQQAVPAILTDSGPETMNTLKATLASAMGQAQVELGAGDPTRTSAITVLPPPLGPMETASMAMPTQFELMMRGDTCMVVHGETGEEHPLDLPCRPLEG
jgi:hypothetical protein